MEADTGRRIHELFDMVCGTSTGGFIALAIAQRKDLGEVALEYETMRQSYAQMSTLETTAKRLAGAPSHSTTTVEESCRRLFGRMRMSELPPTPRVFVVCAAVDTTPLQPYLFRSYELSPEAFAASELLGTANVYTFEAARATTSAPTYYAPVMIGGARLADGAILANNPAMCALAEAALLWPGYPIDAVVSVGTGTNQPRPFPSPSIPSWVRQLIELAMNPYMTHKLVSTLLGPGGCYAVQPRRELSDTEESDALEREAAGRYFRLDPDGLGDVDISETSVVILSDMLEAGRRYMARQPLLFAAVARALRS